MAMNTKVQPLADEVISEALSYLDPYCSREDWIKIGMAVRDSGPGRFHLWDKWSSQCKEKYNAQETARQWETFKAAGRGGVTVATLIHLAREAGWVWPRRDKVPLSQQRPPQFERPMTTAEKNELAEAIFSSPSDSQNEDPNRMKVAKSLERDGFQIVSEYRYSSDFFVYRLEREDGQKTIRPVSFDGKEWRAKAPEGLRPLYNLEELSEEDPSLTVERGETWVLIVEGEKCVECALNLGWTAFTSSSGSQSAHKTDWEPLRGHSVVIVPDRDRAGEAYATSVEKILRGLGCEIRILRLTSIRQKETPEGFDIADWILERERNGLNSTQIGNELVALAIDAPIVARRTGASLLDDLVGFESSLAKTHGVEFLGLPCGYFPRLDGMLDGWQGLGVLAAEPGIGKTTLLLQVGLGIVSRNPDAAFVFLSLEMGRETMKRRLVCQATKIPYRTLRKGDMKEMPGPDGLHLSSGDRKRLAEGLERLRDLAPRISIIDSEDLSGLNLEDLADRIVERVQAFKSLSGCSRAFVLVDHLGRLPMGQDSGLSSIERDDARIAALLGAQRRLDDPLVVVSQVRKSDFNAPGMASAKGSAEISYSPDFILTARRTDRSFDDVSAYGVDLPKETLLEVEMVKGRDGMTRGKVEMKFLVDEQRIEETR